MHQEPFPDPGEDDGQEPDGFLSADADAGPEQGLFLRLPRRRIATDGNLFQ
ncbi:MAG: hypothetical protein ACRDOB_14270 [Streptosporangiaceae bacterium]